MLEEWVGTALVDRGSHPVELTQAGQAFLPRAKEVLDKLEESRHTARAASAEATTTLNFLTTQVVSLTFFPGWFRRALGPKRIETINLTTSSLRGCEQAMLQRSAHFLLCHHFRGMPWQLGESDFTSIVVENDRLLPVSATDSTGRAIYVLSQANADKVPLLAYEPEAGFGRIFRSAFEPERLSSFREVASSHLALLLGLALEGRGVAWVPETVIRHDMLAGRLLEAGGPEWSVPMQIRLFRPVERLSAVAEEFWERVSA